MGGTCGEAAQETSPLIGAAGGKHGPAVATEQSASKLRTPEMHMAIDTLDAMQPPLCAASREALLRAIEDEHVSLKHITYLDLEGLKELGIEPLMERAQILAAAAEHSVMAPAPTAPGGGPLVVEVKVGFVALGQVDTVAQTAWARFFVDLYWHDPRLVGATSVPDGTWFPNGVYIINSAGDLTIDAYDKPVLVDSATGKVLWAQEIQGTLVNRMDLRAFPFDVDDIEVWVHQSEHSNREEYVLRPLGGGWNGYRSRSDEETAKLESTSVQFFFDVFKELDEWLVHGFSTEAFENVGGNGMEYSWYKVHVHVTRRWAFYVWKIILPLFICTIFCMSSFLFEVSELEARNSTSVTMFLATAALLYVVASLLPKTSFLTDIDKFVVNSLVIQFGIGVWSWVQARLLANYEEDVQEEADNYVLMVTFVAYMLCAAYFFKTPMLRSLRAMRNRRSGSVLPVASNAAVHYHTFERFKNVWPKSEVGEKPPNALDPHW
mmetsp:Transcript_42702/g.109304  ORF Transcript_42702/g.109304 Transcript_42702/m.109304 type:complete len:492 (-) Transcript_42702:1095-2570(-)